MTVFNTRCPTINFFESLDCIAEDGWTVDMLLASSELCLLPKLPETSRNGVDRFFLLLLGAGQFNSGNATRLDLQQNTTSLDLDLISGIVDRRFLNSKLFSW